MDSLIFCVVVLVRLSLLSLSCWSVAVVVIMAPHGDIFVVVQDWPKCSDCCQRCSSISEAVISCQKKSPGLSRLQLYCRSLAVLCRRSFRKLCILQQLSSIRGQASSLQWPVFSGESHLRRQKRDSCTDARWRTVKTWLQLSSSWPSCYFQGGTATAFGPSVLRETLFGSQYSLRACLKLDHVMHFTCSKEL